MGRLVAEAVRGRRARLHDLAHDNHRTSTASATPS